MPSTPETMRAAAIDHFGGADLLTPHTLAVPAVGEDEVLIRVDTAGVGVWDPWVREGGLADVTGRQPGFPYVLGSDGAGVVVGVGSRVEHLELGDRVYGFAPLGPKNGFYAEYALVEADCVARVPDSLGLIEAGAMGTDGVTAVVGLDEILELQPKETILVFGASGGLGHLAVQLAKRMGARVLAVASGSDGVELARRLGADAAVDGHSKGGEVAEAAHRFAPDGIDCALVAASGDNLGAAMAAIRDGGRVAYPNGVTPPPEVRAGVSLDAYNGAPSRARLERLNQLIESGEAPFMVQVAHTYSLEQAAQAHRELSEHHLGKLALRVVA